jgi:hypothetical protein
MTFDDMKKEVAYIITNKLNFNNYNVCFIIGDNSTGKTEIGKLVKEMSSNIEVIDNYNQHYNELPKNKKLVVITHYPWILKEASEYDKVIMIYKDAVYKLSDIESQNNVDNMFDQLYNNSKDRLLQVAMSNALQGCWSKLNDEYLEKYKEEKGALQKSDELIINEIDKWKDNNYLYQSA